MSHDHKQILLESVLYQSILGVEHGFIKTNEETIISHCRTYTAAVVQER